jgi:hypothetical protein
MNILTINLLFSTLVFYIAARIYLWPKLPELPARTVLVPILLLQRACTWASCSSRRAPPTLECRWVRTRGVGDLVASSPWPRSRRSEAASASAGVDLNVGHTDLVMRSRWDTHNGTQFWARLLDPGVLGRGCW